MLFYFLFAQDESQPVPAEPLTNSSPFVQPPDDFFNNALEFLMTILTYFEIPMDDLETLSLEELDELLEAIG